MIEDEWGEERKNKIRKQVKSQELRKENRSSNYLINQE